jgi:hypothetical protein
MLPIIRLLTIETAARQEVVFTCFHDAGSCANGVIFIPDRISNPVYPS